MPVAATAWEQVVVLAPAIVLSIGLVAAVLGLLGRAFVHSVRESGHARLVMASLVGLAVFIGVMIYFGIELPREGS
jgi:hypothetical protein